LLTANGLENFYELGAASGLKFSRPKPAEKYSYLDDSAVRNSFVQFTDESITRVNFRVPEIYCIACVWLLENLGRINDAISTAQVNFPRKEVSIQFNNDQIKLSEVVALLTSVGYPPELKLSDLAGGKATPISKRLWLQVGVAGFAFSNIMLFSLPGYFGLDQFSGPTFNLLFGWFSLVLVLPVLIYSAQDYWRAAWSGVRQRRLAIEVPVSLGLAALFLRSAQEVVSGNGPGYFDSLTGLVFFLLIGRVFQQQTYDSLSFDRDYKSFFPLAVTRLERLGDRDSKNDELRSEATGMSSFQERKVSISQVNIGDCLIVRNGELIPADARLISGPAFVDYSFVTGESVPVDKVPGDHLYAGGRQIGAAIEMEILKRVDQSYLTSLWSQDAFKKDKTESINTLINRFSQWFTLTVISIAALAAGWWLIQGAATTALVAFASVMIVACPCALALVTPFTLGTALRILGKERVFLKNTGVIENMSQIDTVVFDKTGTLTSSGAGSIVFVGELLSENEERWLFSMTRHSIHPYAVQIGESISRTRQIFPDPVRSFLETAGKGMEGSVAGREIWMGSAAWLAARNTTNCPSTSDSDTHENSAATGSEVHVAIDGVYRGAFVIKGSLRPEAENMLTHLAGEKELVLLSGDNSREEKLFSELLGDRAQLRFFQTPLDKLEFVASRQKAGRKVMMVGDGLNDAGALRQSDVGLAVVEETGAFSPASDGIMSSDQVCRLDRIVGFSKSSIRVIKIGFGISAAYNIMGIAVATTGLLSPIFCAILMPISSITVVVFSTAAVSWCGRRLRRTDVPPVTDAETAQPMSDVARGPLQSASGIRERNGDRQDACPTLEVSS